MLDAILYLVAGTILVYAVVSLKPEWKSKIINFGRRVKVGP